MNKYNRIYSQIGDVYIKELVKSNFFFENCDNGISLINEPTPEVVFNKSSIKELPDYMEGNLLPVVTEKVKKILSSLPDSRYFEFIALKSNTLEKVWLVNLLENIKCFDWEKSEYSTFPETDGINFDMPDRITKLSLKTEVIGNRNLFRMYESSIHIFISDYLENLFNQNNVKGFKIVRNLNLWCYNDED